MMGVQINHFESPYIHKWSRRALKCVPPCRQEDFAMSALGCYGPLLRRIQSSIKGQARKISTCTKASPAMSGSK